MFFAFDHLAQSPSPARIEGAVAVLPLAAIEAHGPHLPLGTDGIIASGILDRAGALDQSSLPVLRLPPLWLGASTEHADRAGTLSTSPEALIATIEAIGDGLAHAGVRRIVLFNGHGGNIAAGEIAALKLRTRAGLLAASIHWLDFGLPDIAMPAPVKGDVHGGWVETSVMLHLAPSLVGADRTSEPGKAPAACLFPEGRLKWGWMTSDIAPGGWIGRPDLGTAALGRAFVEHAAKELAATLQQIAAAPWSPR
jgi:creatinine amidohydrolase